MALERAEKVDASGNSSVSKYTGVPGTLDYNVCRKIEGIVTVSGRIHTMGSNTTAQGMFFEIPDGYRPSSDTYTMGSMNIINVGFVPVLAHIRADGLVEMIFSQSYKVDLVAFSATYKVV